jgi:class 3 adenylate cyclase
MSEQVTAWLEDLELGQYSIAFEENAIDWGLLPELDQETLKDIGVSIAGHRLRILKAAKALTLEQPAITPGTDAQASRESAPSSLSEVDATAWSRTPGERKPVTMMFADVVGSTNLTEKMDAEEAHELLYRATQLMCEAVEKNQGTVCRFMGDGIMAMFGAPIASERHALEACWAAVDMQAAVSRYSVKLESTQGAGLQIRVGLNSGEVVVLEVGDNPEKPEYDASGPTVPLAARMEQSAEAGTILITEETRTLAGEFIDSTELPAIDVKGVSQTLAVYQLKAIKSANESSTSISGQPIIGRKSEIVQFHGLLHSCLESGYGQTIILRGEAGIGKTRLVEEMTNLALEVMFACHKALVLDFGAGKGQEAIPSLVRSLLDISQGSSKRVRELALERAEQEGNVKPDNRVFLNDLLDLKQPLELRTLYDAMDPQARKEGKRAALIEMLKSLALHSPVFIVVEDLHWADDITLDYLARLAATVTECKILIVFTTRVEGDPIDSSWRARAEEAPIVTWDLSPLRKEEAAKLVSDYLDASDSLAKRCIERAAGNPLFLKQLILSVEKGTSDSIPDSIKSLVLSRMDQLPNEDKLVLQAAAVLGQRFELDCLRFLIDSPVYECQQLVERHFLRPEGSLYLFAHALIQEGAYSSLLNQQRIEWHRKAANWYAEHDLILHAEHLGYAGDAAAPKAYCRAAEEQVAHFRPERALHLVRAGLELASDTDSFELKCLEGELLRVLGSALESIAAYRNASKAAINDVELCRALVGVSEGLELTEEHEQLIKELAKAEALAKNHSLSLEMANILKLRAGVHFFKSDKDACLEASNAALEYANDSGSTEMIARALSGLADAEYNRGHFDAAYRYYDQCIEFAREHGLGRVIAANLSMRGFISHFRNDVDSKKADYIEAVELAQKTRDLRSEFIALSGGSLWAEMGEIDKGQEWLEKGFAIVQKLGSKLFEAEYRYLFARIECMKGDYERARKYAKESVSGLKASESGMTFRGPTALGVYATTIDDPGLRRDILHEAELILAGDCLDHNFLDFYEDAMQACIRAGDWDEVDRYARELENYTASEPLHRCKLFIDRGRALAAFGRENRDQDIMRELQRVHEETARVKLKFALPELEAALQSV